MNHSYTASLESSWLEAIKETIQLRVKVYLLWVSSHRFTIIQWQRGTKIKLKITRLLHAICFNGFNVTKNYSQHKLSFNLTLIFQFEYTYFHDDMIARYIVKILSLLNFFPYYLTYDTEFNVKYPSYFSAMTLKVMIMTIIWINFVLEKEWWKAFIL